MFLVHNEGQSETKRTVTVRPLFARFDCSAQTRTPEYWGFAEPVNVSTNISGRLVANVHQSNSGRCEGNGPCIGLHEGVLYMRVLVMTPVSSSVTLYRLIELTREKGGSTQHG
jgi:hypothetical protein